MAVLAPAIPALKIGDLPTALTPDRTAINSGAGIREQIERYREKEIEEWIPEFETPSILHDMQPYPWAR